MVVHSKKKKTGLKFRPGFILLFVAASFAACFAMYMKNDGEDTAAKDLMEKLNPSVTEQTEPSEETAPPVVNPVGRSERADDDYFDSCAFIGDSSVMGFFSYAIVKFDNIFMLEDMQDTSALSAIYERNDIKNIYLFFSPGGISTDEGRTAFAEKMADIASKLRTGGFKGDIYLVSVLPESIEAEQIGLYTNADIDKLNTMLLGYANEHGIYYIDENTYFKGTDGRLKSSYVGEDGISMAESAYNAAAEMIRTHTAAK